MKRQLLGAILCCATLFAVPAAAADGGPSPGTAWGDGLVSPDGKLRYVTLFGGASSTVVAAVSVHGGRVVRWANIRGNYGVPRVTTDGAMGGLSRDGRTLVLASWASVPNPGAVTRFAVFDTRKFRLRRVVTLRGSFSYDAMSPTASTLYLIQYTSSRHYDRYRVRAYDLARRALVPGAIVDKREPKEPMGGSPLSRVTTRDGAWVFTLYARSGGPSFIHALDAVHRRAECLDLPRRFDLGVRLGLSADELKILVLQRKGGAPIVSLSAPSV